MGARWLQAILTGLLLVALAACRSADTLTPSPSDQTAAAQTSALATATPAAINATPTVLDALSETPTLSNSPPRRDADEASSERYIVVYADTSRVESAMTALMDASPGFMAETYALSSEDIYLALRDDLARGQPLADLYLVGDAPRTLALLGEGALVNAVPAELASVLPADAREPLLTHHWTALTWVLSSSPDEANAIDNWWDLTRAAWRGRLVLPDPTLDERTLAFLVTVTQHGDEMAAAYRLEFGQDIVLDADCPTAGWQWVKELVRNAPNWALNDADVTAQLASAKPAQPWVGLCGSEQWEKAARNALAIAPLLDAQPAAGLKWRSYLALVASSQRPQAAREAIAWLMGDAEGGAGYAVWHKPGFYPARSDVPDPPGAPQRDTLAARLWELDPAYLEAQRLAVRDLVAPYVGHPVGGR